MDTIGNNIKADRESCRMGIAGFVLAVIGLCIFFCGLFALAGVLNRIVLPNEPIEKRIEIDKQGQTLIAWENDKQIYVFPITTGGVESPTKVGDFEVLDKIENVESYHGYTFPLWIGVYTVGRYENGIHSVEGDNPWTGNIGKEPSTAGSIILMKEDMKALYEWAELGIKIYIHN